MPRLHDAVVADGVTSDSNAEQTTPGNSEEILRTLNVTES